MCRVCLPDSFLPLQRGQTLAGCNMPGRIAVPLLHPLVTNKVFPVCSQACAEYLSFQYSLCIIVSEDNLVVPLNLVLDHSTYSIRNSSHLMENMVLRPMSLWRDTHCKLSYFCYCSVNFNFRRGRMNL